jgi:tRNA A-37 threonylcarbamoyl transferase component Bud32/predicted nucleotidyltransferase
MCSNSWSIPSWQLATIRRFVSQIAKGRSVVGICLYGSQVAGYARSESDFDIIVVLQNYPFALKYVYSREEGHGIKDHTEKGEKRESAIDISALVVDRQLLEKDASEGYLGEFVVGRLLHIYEPIENQDFFNKIEQVYKRRVILEEINQLIQSTNVLSTEIMFPLEFVMFAKIRRRSALYPNAIYSYYRTYTGSRAEQNIEFALDGYRRALNDIIRQDDQLFEIKGKLLKISEKRVATGNRGEAYLRLTKRLQEFSSYLVHTYAGRHAFHLALKEAQSKLMRHHHATPKLPEFISHPDATYLKLSEGMLIFEASKKSHRVSEKWLDVLAESIGFARYDITKQRLGNLNSKTSLIRIVDREAGKDKEKRIVVKELAKSKSIKWAALNIWTSPVKRFRVDPLFRLGCEYKALRYVRTLGLCSPAVECVVLDRRLLVTEFIEGKTLADIIKSHIKAKTATRVAGGGEMLDIAIRVAGKQIATVHSAGSSFGNIKPKNIIARQTDGNLYFTDLEQFIFKAGDQLWDLAQFLGWALKGTTNVSAAMVIAKEFLCGYLGQGSVENVRKLAKSKRHMESFYPVLAPSVARALKNQINIAAETS